jgi:hypothetical protein
LIKDNSFQIVCISCFFTLVHFRLALCLAIRVFLTILVCVVTRFSGVLFTISLFFSIIIIIILALLGGKKTIEALFDLINSLDGLI